MSETVVVDAEDMQRAAIEISAAAENMLRAAREITEAVATLRRVLEDDRAERSRR